MISKRIIFNWQRQIVIGIVAGVTISIIDNYAFEGEVSPIVIVLLLLAASGFAGLLYSWRGWFSVFVMWMFVPAAHLIKYVLGLPDTLHPNTLNSILKLAIFTLVVVTIGISGGVLLRKFTKSQSNPTKL